MKRIALAAIFALISGILPAVAEVVTYDASLVSPDTNPIGPTNLSWYNGSGNAAVQGGWTVANGNGIELGLGAILRQVNGVIDEPNGTYYVPPGIEVNPPAQTTNPARDAWNYQFSIDLNPGGTSTTLTLNQVTASLQVTNLNTLTTFTFDPTALTDDSGFGTAGGMTLFNASSQASRGNVAPLGTEWGAQNSQNPLFGGFAPVMAYDMNAADTYRIDLNVYLKSNNSLLASDTIDVVVTPEPSTFALLAIGGLAVYFLRRRLSIV
jgi:hypothetical protein